MLTNVLLPTIVNKIALTQLVPITVLVPLDTRFNLLTPVRTLTSVLLSTIVNNIATTQLAPILVPVCRDSLYNQICSHVSQESVS